MLRTGPDSNKGAPMPFNHFDEDGHARMVDVSAKEPTLRSATARAVVHLGTQLLKPLLL